MDYYETVSESEQDYMSLIANHEIVKREIDDCLPVQIKSTIVLSSELTDVSASPKSHDHESKNKESHSFQISCYKIL